MTSKQAGVDPKIMDRLVSQGAFLLKTFHQEASKNSTSRETEFWRGNLTGFRHTVESVYGQSAMSELLSRVRQSTSLKIPHAGQMDAAGDYLGFASECDL